MRDEDDELRKVYGRELNNLYQCKECFGYTPRKDSTCIWCDNPLPEKEVKEDD